ncbi:MAG: enoyl-CoA hydratase/isomerase family protein [Acidimicrobiia bacterium]|nr:enoyl-CoA hydratase/isomerase family protein [Acidimicrobiia bacterium]
MTDSQPDQLVLRHDRDGVATLTLNRPEKLNALTPAMFAELRAHVDDLAGDEAIGCVVLTGAGRSFCAGNDLGGIAEGVRAPSPHFQAETIDALEQLPQPTIAKIRGHCFTGGLELALGCDLLVATESAQLGDTHGQWGLVASWGMTVRLPERVGRARAKELMYTARRITGANAAAIGLVNAAAADDDLDAAVDSLCAEIVANSWDTSRFDKAILADTRDMDRPEALAYERSTPYGRPRDMAERLQRPRS